MKALRSLIEIEVKEYLYSIVLLIGSSKKCVLVSLIFFKDLIDFKSVLVRFPCTIERRQDFEKVLCLVAVICNALGYCIVPRCLSF
jgi:hypothetical protein